VDIKRFRTRGAAKWGGGGERGWWQRGKWKVGGKG